MQQTFLHLDIAQWLAVIAGLLLILIVFGLFGGRRNANRINVHGNKNKVVVDQRDQSVRQTNITAKINVQAPATSASSRQPVDRNDNANAFPFGAGIVLAMFTPLYVYFFDIFVAMTQLLYLLAFGAGIGLVFLALFQKTGAPLRVALQAGFLTIVSGAGAWFLIDAQSLIDPRVLDWAQSLPLQGSSIGIFFKGIWRAHLFEPTIISAAICLLCVFACIYVLRMLYRIAFLAFLGTALHEEVAARVLPSWSLLLAPVGLLAMLGMLRFYVLPNAALSGLLG